MVDETDPLADAELGGLETPPAADGLPEIDPMLDPGELPAGDLEVPGMESPDMNLADLLPPGGVEDPIIGDGTLSASPEQVEIEADLGMAGDLGGSPELPVLDEEPQMEMPNASDNSNISMTESIQSSASNILGAGVLDMNTIRNIKVNVQAVLGGISMSVSKLSDLKEGEVISLEKNIGDEIEIHANGQLIAHGEIVVIEGDIPKFGISITSIVGT